MRLFWFTGFVFIGLIMKTHTRDGYSVLGLDLVWLRFGLKKGISKLLDSSMIHCYKLCSTMSPPFSSSIKKTFIVSLRISSYISYLQVAFSLIVKLCFDVLSSNRFHHYDFGSRLASSTDYFVRFSLLDFFFLFYTFPGNLFCLVSVSVHLLWLISFLDLFHFLNLLPFYIILYLTEWKNKSRRRLYIRDICLALTEANAATRENETVKELKLGVITSLSNLRTMD